VYGSVAQYSGLSFLSMSDTASNRPFVQGGGLLPP
jgi:hypothetical protein